MSLESLIARHGLEARNAQEIKSWTIEDVRALGLDDFSRLQVSTLLESVRQSDSLAKRIEEKVLGEVKPTKDFTRIQKVPGIGPILGLTILLESGEFARFASAGDYASYCRAVKSECTSNGKKKGSNNRKNGNKYLAWAFMEATHYAVRYYPRIAAWYEKKKKRRNVPVAKKALACKLAKAVWHVMNGAEYDEKMLFG